MDVIEVVIKREFELFAKLRRVDLKFSSSAFCTLLEVTNSCTDIPTKDAASTKLKKRNRKTKTVPKDKANFFLPGPAFSAFSVSSSNTMDKRERFKDIL